MNGFLSFKRCLSPFLLTACCLLPTYIFSQDKWTQRSDFGGQPRCTSFGFSIGNKGYIGVGIFGINWAAVYNDMWEWNQATDTWTQKANYPAYGTNAPIGFSIGNKGYVGTGSNYGAEQKDFWEYDPLTNLWTQKADFGGGTRASAVGFSIGNKGYVGTGFDKFGKSWNDFWEYDALSNTWTQRANFGGGPRDGAVGFSIGNKGYIGTGENGTPYTGFNDFWEYDAANDTWTQKANFSGVGRLGAIGFSIGNYGYIGTGDILAANGSSLLIDFWQYDPNNDTWAQMANYGGGPRAGVASFVIGCKGYVGTGVSVSANSNGVDTKDFWQYTPPVPSAAMAGVNTICAGDSTSLFASGGLFFHWNNGATSNIISVTPTVTTTYSVIVSDSCGADTASMVVTVIPNPVAKFISNLDSCMYCGKFFDQSSNAFAWAWSFGDTTTSALQNPDHCYKDTGTYFVSLITSSTNGMCRDSSKTKVHFSNTDETKVVVSNVFSPNGDGINDIFSIPGLDKCEPYTIKIYDRWGLLMFETTAAGNTWDGTTSSGTKAEAGTYYYILSNNKTSRKGFVTLLR